MSRRYWYLYDGNGDDLVPGNYCCPQNTKPSGCIGGPVSCAIYVPNGGSNPTEISDNIKDYLTFAKINQIPCYPLIGIPYVGTKQSV